MSTEHKEKEIRAFYTDRYIRVYQAYNDAIADSALMNKRFVSPPFKIERTTWIKPSFLWMMYRSGWATKENQQRILAIDITHQGFSWALEHSCLSHFISTVYSSREEWQRVKANSPVVIQWDPERDIYLNKLPHRAIQVGLTPEAAKKYINDWIIGISDITELAQTIKSFLDKKDITQGITLLPEERKYPLPEGIIEKLGIK
ncbi:MAG: hypothetical protein BGO55_10030 [Sphingobacteriales bacterium 50-39]|nr:DUF4291 domain-containing protein [Sphingobacteriales bacterium]OJW57877.1 MAG: hypothetical protein BGO55_10030 [Sphingobacteriales bacterium 50-39]